MSSTIILGAIIGLLLIIIIVLLVTGKSDDAEPEHIPPEPSDPNMTLTPNTVINQTAPLEKGKPKKNKKKEDIFETQDQLAKSGKDETFLPQTAATPAEEDDDDSGEEEALTESQKK